MAILVSATILVQSKGSARPSAAHRCAGWPLPPLCALLLSNGTNAGIEPGATRPPGTVQALPRRAWSQGTPLLDRAGTSRMGRAACLMWTSCATMLHASCLRQSLRPLAITPSSGLSTVLLSSVPAPGCRHLCGDLRHGFWTPYSSAWASTPGAPRPAPVVRLCDPRQHTCATAISAPISASSTALATPRALSINMFGRLPPTVSRRHLQ
jgi:hypothetical protein